VHQGSPFASHHRFYGALIQRELDHTKAMRYLLRTAKRQQIQIASALQQFVSPLLVKEHGYGEQGRQLANRLGSLNISPYEAGLVRLAFSPMADVKALVEIGDYPTAQQVIERILAQEKYSAFHSEASQELSHVLEAEANEAL